MARKLHPTGVTDEQRQLIEHLSRRPRSFGPRLWTSMPEQVPRTTDRQGNTVDAVGGTRLDADAGAPDDVS